MGRASALLIRRPAAVVALAALVGLYYAFAESLWNGSVWWDVAFLALVVFPCVFALVYLPLPLVGSRVLLVATPVLVALAIATTAAGLGAAANFAKLAAATAVGWFLAEFLDDLALIVVIAAIIPFVDAWSVWRGPTHVIVTNRRDIFQTFAFSFPLPGEHSSAGLGLPDLLFFAFFLAACVLFRLRAACTWAAMTASFGLTMVLAVWLDLGGLPALPGLSVAFLAVNADLLWRKLAARRFHRFK